MITVPTPGLCRRGAMAWPRAMPVHELQSCGEALWVQKRGRWIVDARRGTDDWIRWADTEGKIPEKHILRQASWGMVRKVGSLEADRPPENQVLGLNLEQGGWNGKKE